MVEFSKGKKMLCRNWSFLLSFLGCENKSTCKVEPRNSWPEEHNSKTRGKEELKLIDSSPCCRPVLVEQLQNEACSRRGMEIEQWNLINDCQKYIWRASLSILAMAILMGWSKLLPFAVVIGNGQDNRSGPGASSKFFYLIIFYMFPYEYLSNKKSWISDPVPVRRWNISVHRAPSFIGNSELCILCTRRRFVLKKELEPKK